MESSHFPFSYHKSSGCFFIQQHFRKLGQVSILYMSDYFNNIFCDVSICYIILRAKKSIKMYAYRMVSNNFPNFPYRKSPDCFFVQQHFRQSGAVFKYSTLQVI